MTAPVEYDEAKYLSASKLTIDEQRELVYASLLRYTSETATLRERVLDRVVLGGLIESTAEAPHRIGNIVSNRRFGENTLTIRTQAVQEALDRLVAQQKAGRTAVRKGAAFYLDNSGEEELLSVASSSVAKQRRFVVLHVSGRFRLPV